MLKRMAMAAARAAWCSCCGLPALRRPQRRRLLCCKVCGGLTNQYLVTGHLVAVCLPRIVVPEMQTNAALLQVRRTTRRGGPAASPRPTALRRRP
jgi:hypothetical protein